VSSNDRSLLIEELGIRSRQCPTAIDAVVNLISTSYKVNANGTLTAVTQSLPTFASGNCWNAITPDGTKVYVSNSASNDISGFNIGKES
jgi:DNA-binding beta-propeller fold protein YncE